MITKEYRIPMPLGVDEYRIAQLYMIAKKSRIESEGEESGIEIITNQPYSDGPGGHGQYTDKTYHVAAHIPSWLRSFLPKSLPTLREEAWNAYPYSKNKFSASFTDRFSMDMESKYLIGGTKQENVFGLNDQELSERVVEVIDFVKDKLYGSDYEESEDPLLYKSERTNREPLTEDWLKSYEEQADNVGSNENFMCVYKLCRVRFDMWPIQYRVEKFAHDCVKRTLIRAHRQAWVWQDEWNRLTMEQIRELERETQECLANMMRKANAS